MKLSPSRDSKFDFIQTQTHDSASVPRRYVISRSEYDSGWTIPDPITNIRKDDYSTLLLFEDEYRRKLLEVQKIKSRKKRLQELDWVQDWYNNICEDFVAPIILEHLNLFHGEPSNNIELSQKDKINCFVGYDPINEISQVIDRGSPVLVSGEAGTGKTSLIKYLVKHIPEEVDTDHIVLTYTGVASSVCRKKRLKSETIHRACKADYSSNFQLGPHDCLKQKYVFIDEASMINVLTFAKLLCCLRDDVNLYVTGDHRQLPPVTGLSVFHYLTNYISHVELTKVLRNSYRIEDVIPKKIETTQEYIDLIKSLPVLGKKSIVISNSNYQNDMINMIKTGGRGLAKNDPVMVTKNDYDNGCFNGELGYYQGHKHGKYELKIDERSILYAPYLRNSFKMAYSITVHKSQGGEWDEVIIILDEKKGYPHDNVSLLYTAFTRSKKDPPKLYVVDSSKLDSALIEASLDKIDQKEESLLRVNKRFRKKVSEKVREEKAVELYGGAYQTLAKREKSRPELIFDRLFKLSGIEKKSVTLKELIDSSGMAESYIREIVFELSLRGLVSYNEEKETLRIL